MILFQNIFRLVAFLEGLSYILLLFIATPIKYLYHNPSYVKLLGMPHGLLFVAYIGLAIALRPDYKWTTRQFSWVLLASIIPFGTFYIDYAFIKKSKV